MSAFTRIKDIIASNLTTLLDRAEDPGKMIDLSIRKLEDAASSMRKALKEKMDEKAKVEGRLTEARAAIARWQERARAAAARGMDDLAREAIAARRELERKADRDAERGKIAVTDVNILIIFIMARAAEVSGGGMVGIRPCDRIGQPAAGVYLAEQYVCAGVARLHTALPDIKNRLNMSLIRRIFHPAHIDDV